MNTIKTLVVDDEEFNRSLIIGLIKELNPAFDILGQAGSVKAAYELINKIQPQIVFLDIKMPDGSGFELLSMFHEINFEVVFISAFDSYALKAFEFNAIDYILKPVEPEKFSVTLTRLQSRIERNVIQPEDLKAIIQSYDLRELIISKIPLHNGNKVVLLDILDLISISAVDGYTLFKTATHEKYISSKQLSDFDFILDTHPCMVRVNKGIYINLKFIKSYSKGLTCFLNMKDGSTVEISRRKKKEVLELLAGKKENE